MSRSRLHHISLSFFISLTATIAAVALDGQRSSIHQMRTGLSWARQVATQAESMVFKAKEDGERDPLGWVVNYLAQGIEPRLVHVTRVSTQLSGNQDPEGYAFKEDTGLFEYTKWIMPESGSGIRVSIQLGYLGFLGSKSVFTADLMVLLVFAMCFAIPFFATGRYFGFDDTGRIRSRILEWVAAAKSQLTHHGIHIREMVRQAQRLAVSSGQSRDRVTELRGKIHEGLTELHHGRQFYKEGESIAQKAEALALNTAIEANRLGEDARGIAQMATDLHRQIRSLAEINRRGRALVEELEKKIEPWATDADLALQSFEPIKEATDLMGQHIRGTTESLMGQAKMIQGLHLELAPAEETKTPRAPALSPEAATTPLPAPLPALSTESEPKVNTTAPAPTQSRNLPEPLPPIEENRPLPLFRRLKARKSA